MVIVMPFKIDAGGYPMAPIDAVTRRQLFSLLKGAVCSAFYLTLAALAFSAPIKLVIGQLVFMVIGAVSVFAELWIQHAEYKWGKWTGRLGNTCLITCLLLVMGWAAWSIVHPLWENPIGDWVLIVGAALIFVIDFAIGFFFSFVWIFREWAAEDARIYRQMLDRLKDNKANRNP